MTSQQPSQIADEIRSLVDVLSASQDPAAFQELLGLSGYVGEALGASARSLAEAQSWTSVATHAGTTKQAAWSRWHY